MLAGAGGGTVRSSRFGDVERYFAAAVTIMGRPWGAGTVYARGRLDRKSGVGRLDCKLPKMSTAARRSIPLSEVLAENGRADAR
jgi:hypothetical protein